MTNPKGRVEENRIVSLLRAYVWPGAEREGKRAESRDVINTGTWVVEVKHRKAWRLFEWIRKIRKVADDDWVIFVGHGDRRTSEGREVGTVAVCDAERFMILLDEAGYREDRTDV